MTPKEVVEVPPRPRPYVPYAYWLLAAPTLGYHGRDVCPTAKLLASAWENMMGRCYDTQNPKYRLYGGQGVSVCKRWHVLDIFMQDVKSLYGWDAKLADWDGYRLDKDYYSSNQYSPETCVWLSLVDNSTYMKTVTPIVVTLQGEKAIFLSISEAARATNVPSNTISQWLTGASKQAKYLDLVFEYAAPRKQPLRYKL